MARITAPPAPAKKLVPPPAAVKAEPPQPKDIVAVQAEAEEETEEFAPEAAPTHEEQVEAYASATGEPAGEVAPHKTRQVAGQAELAEREIRMIDNIVKRLTDRVSLWRPGSNPDHKGILADMKQSLTSLSVHLKGAETDFHTLLDTDYKPVKAKVKGVLEVGARVEFAGAYAASYAEILTAAELDSLFVSRITETGKFVVSTSDPETGDDRIVGVISNNGIKVR